MNRALCVLFGLTLSLPISVFAQQSTVVEEIVARVNNSIITRAELTRSREQMAQEARQQDAAHADAAIQNHEKDVLRDLVDQQLLVQKGQELGITADVELIKRLDEIRKQMNATSLDDLEKIAQQQGISFEDFKQNLKNSIITQQVISREVGSHIQVSKQDVANYYEEHRSELDQPEQVRLSEMLIAIDPEHPKSELSDPDPQLVATAEAKANDLLRQIRSGASFEELSKKNSSGPTAAQGGDLGFFKRGMLAKALEQQTFALKAGGVTDVIRTRQGFVILKVTAHDQAGTPSMEKVADAIREQLYMQRVQPALRTYLTKLREEAYIDVKAGYVDTGASPNQTKPIYTEASNNSPATPDKKKKKHLFF